MISKNTFRTFLLWLIPISITFQTQAAHTISADTLHLDKGWEFSRHDSTAWLPATVPGVVQYDLIRHGLLPDPNYRLQEEQAQWPEEHDWDYRLLFSLTEQQLRSPRAILMAEGLDTYATVFLNGKKIMESRNMFVGREADITGLLRQSGNELLIRFRSPMKEVRPLRQRDGFDYPADNDHHNEKLSVYTRKAPYQYGWDWGPRLVTTGVWRPVGIRFEGAVAFASKPEVTYTLTKDAQVNCLFPLSWNEQNDRSVRLVVELYSPNGRKVHSEELTAGYGQPSCRTSFTVLSPDRWMPNGIGLPLMYTLVARLQDKDGTTWQTYRTQIGFRTVEFVREEDTHGRSFFFRINGKPLYMKGANYIPGTMMLSARTEEYWQELFRSVSEANMNMLRVWGGGIYEDERFYELADANGILIWQDFAFACTPYPGDEEFLRNVREEADYNIRRLREHPSLALWCGNNEIREGLKYWGWQKRFDRSTYQKFLTDYDKLFCRLLPERVAALDPTHAYVETSPDTANWGRPATLAWGDSHYWGVWYGREPFGILRERIPRFMSEFGFESFPERKTLESFAWPEDMQLDSPVMKARQKSSMGNEIILEYMQRDYPKPKDFDDFVFKSLIMQGQGMRIGLEAQRAAKPYCMGSLYWQLNDAWPAISWSGIDYYGNWKPLHYQVRRAFEPVIIVPDAERRTISIVSDAPEAKGEDRMALRIEPISFGGKRYPTFWVRNIEVDNEHPAVLPFPIEQWLPQELQRTNLLRLSLVEDVGEAYGEVWASTLYYHHSPKDLLLPVAPPISQELRRTGLRTWELTVRSPYLVKDLFVETDALGARFSDNAFDLLPNEERRLIITLPTDSTEEPVIRLRHL